MKIRIITSLFCAALLMAGCSKKDIEQQPAGTAVEFATTITRASGTTWGNGDPIGVFMTPAGQALNAATPLAANKLFTATAAGAITADATNTIYYPDDGTTVDFVAYYPYRATTATPYVYNVDVADQSTASKQAAADLLYSNDATAKSRSRTAVPMTFVHQLSLLEINVVRGTTLSTVDFSTVTASIQGMPVTVDFSLVDGTTFSNPGAAANITPLTVTATESGVAYTAILIPQPTGGTTRKVVFTLGTDSYTWSIPDAMVLAKGQRNAYTITINNPGLTVSAATITPWDENTLIDGTGERVQYEYQVGDYYPDPNAVYSGGTLVSGIAAIGVVYSITNGGKNGQVVSLDEGVYLAWSAENVLTGATSATDGKANQTAIESIAGFTTKYPAFNWVYVKNGSLPSGPWYLPAIGELLALYAVWNGSSSSTANAAARAAFNAKLTAPGGTALSNDYWSSSQSSANDARLFYFDWGYSNNFDKPAQNMLRAVRTF